MGVEFRREVVASSILHPMQEFRPVEGSVEVRWDPLTGHTARLVSGGPLLPASSFDLEAFAAATRAGCFFCPEKVFDVTPRLLPEIHPEGRLRRGSALLFPNLQAYAQYSSVSIYGPEHHFLTLDRFTPRLVADNLAVQVEFVRAVARFDPAAVWASINSNHLLPSGGSLFHPHVQAAVDPVPSTMQALLAGVPGSSFAEFLAAERSGGERLIADSGSVVWVAAFAPVGFYEVRAFVPGVASPAELSEAVVAELGEGISRVLGVYSALGQQSFNFAFYGAPAAAAAGGYPLNLRMVCRSNLQAGPYRSDAMYFERLHWQSAVDYSPEEFAERARAAFA